MSSISSDSISTCSNCGKGGEGNSDGIQLKSCAACRMVKYCSRECQAAHRPQHKKACKKRAAELYDEKLFKEPPPPEDCPICMLPMPISGDEKTFKSCCGKTICNGCIYAIAMSKGGTKQLCAYCRTPPPTSYEEEIKKLKKLLDKDNSVAYLQLAGDYAAGSLLPQDHQKANELYLKGAELGCAASYFNLGLAYRYGWGVERDDKKVKHYTELAAMGGYIHARHNLGCEEWNTGNYFRAVKHFIMAARAGEKVSLDMVKKGFMKGFVSKDEYANTLRAYHERQKEMKSDQRDQAAASGIFHTLRKQQSGL